MDGTEDVMSPMLSAARSDIPRSLTLTFEDDLSLPRYREPVPIQSEPISVTMRSRREKILMAVSDSVSSPVATPRDQPVPLPIAFPDYSTGETPVASPSFTSFCSPLTSRSRLEALSVSPIVAAPDDFGVFPPSTNSSLSSSFMNQPLETSAVGRPRAMSSAKNNPFLQKQPIPPSSLVSNVENVPVSRPKSLSPPLAQKPIAGPPRPNFGPHKEAPGTPKWEFNTPKASPPRPHRMDGKTADGFVKPSAPLTPRINRGSTTPIKAEHKTPALKKVPPFKIPGSATAYHTPSVRKVKPSPSPGLETPTKMGDFEAHLTEIFSPFSSKKSQSSLRQLHAPLGENEIISTSTTADFLSTLNSVANEDATHDESPLDTLTFDLSPRRTSDSRTSVAPSLSPHGYNDLMVPITPKFSSENSLDWNARFIASLEEIGQLTHNSHAIDRLKAYEKLALLAGDFNDTVRRYGKIIISEAYLPVEKKTIKPINLGGIVGGDKYVVHGIVFKFAVDSKKLYAGDEHAAKVAGHDLKSLVHIYNCWERGVHFPMMTIVDYRGFRIVGMPCLPIDGTRTLVYGSSDAGATIRKHPFLDQQLHSIAQKLNLKSHLVGKEGVEFSTPIDLEGHLGTDDKFYLLDFSRLFPPQYPPEDRENRMTHLYELLRPEFVRMYERPLCSDAFSSFICPDGASDEQMQRAEEDEAEIQEATRYLTEVVVQVFAQKLVELPKDQREGFPLIMLLHESGINVRFLGLLFTYLTNLKDDYWIIIILVEMAARVIKVEMHAMLREKMHELKHPGDGPYKTGVVQYLNTVFGTSPQAKKHWQTSIQPSMESKFRGLKIPKEYQSKDLLSVIVGLTQSAGITDGRCLLFKAVSKLLGLRFVKDTWRNCCESPEYFEQYAPFTDTDIKELHEKVKEMNVAAHSSGFMLRYKASQVPNTEESMRLLSQAAQAFERALEGNPDNKVTLRNLGDCQILLGQNERGIESYQRALRADNEDPNTLYKYAIALDKLGHLDEAEEHYIQSLENYPFHSNCCLAYADFLCYQRKNFEESNIFYQRAIDIGPTNYPAYNNYGVFLATVGKDTSRAEDCFLKAVHGSPNTVVYLENYASFLLHIRRDLSKADEYITKAKRLRRKQNLMD